MKPTEKKPEIVYRIINRESGNACGSYSRACHDEFDFTSAYYARHANVHGKFEDTKEYKIAKYKVTYTLIEDECDIEGKGIPVQSIGEPIPRITLFDMYYKLYHEKGLTSTAARCMDELNLTEDWKVYLKVKQDEYEQAKIKQ